MLLQKNQDKIETKEIEMKHFRWEVIWYVPGAVEI